MEIPGIYKHFFQACDVEHNGFNYLLLRFMLVWDFDCQCSDVDASCGNAAVLMC